MKHESIATLKKLKVWVGDCARLLDAVREVESAGKTSALSFSVTELLDVEESLEDLIATAEDAEVA